MLFWTLLHLVKVFTFQLSHMNNEKVYSHIHAQTHLNTNELF